ncbi:hypothetical protein LCGC14_0799480 [marine sediment metagenome]|uniref:Uncharacterized protein n=1 Tax=marine sediment metagenome TaxID=412755 RepID=A0A0F9SXA3_9ZZZZ
MYFVISYPNDPKDGRRVDTHYKETLDEAVALADSINSDTELDRHAEYREEMPDEKQKTYTAIHGKNDSPIIRIHAGNGMEARDVITTQLSMPGRELTLAMWRKYHCAMRTEDGLILYYSEELESLVTIPEDEMVSSPDKQHVPEGLTEDEALVIKAYKAIFIGGGWADEIRYTTYKNLTIELWRLKHIEVNTMKQLVKDVVRKGFMAWRGIEKIYLTQAGIWAAEQL